MDLFTANQAERFHADSGHETGDLVDHHVFHPRWFKVLYAEVSFVLNAIKLGLCLEGRRHVVRNYRHKGLAFLRAVVVRIDTRVVFFANRNLLLSYLSNVGREGRREKALREAVVLLVTFNLALLLDQLELPALVVELELRHKVDLFLLELDFNWIALLLLGERGV